MQYIKIFIVGSFIPSIQECVRRPGLGALVQKIILLKEQNAYFAYNFCSVSVAGVIMPQIVQWFHDMQR